MQQERELAASGHLRGGQNVGGAKIENVNLLAAPEAGADPIGSVTAVEALVYLGTEENGYLRVQSPSGQGWINRLLVTKRQ